MVLVVCSLSIMTAFAANDPVQNVQHYTPLYRKRQDRHLYVVAEQYPVKGYI